MTAAKVDSSKSSSTDNASKKSGKKPTRVQIEEVDAEEHEVRSRGRQTQTRNSLFGQKMDQSVNYMMK